MKIHIVQKGDTIWEIAKEYGVDFEQVKELNPQISSPDMIMPGMKIKIPSATKTVNKEKKTVKEEAYKDISPKPIQAIQEDDSTQPKEVKIEMPKMPVMEKEMPQMSHYPMKETIAKEKMIPPMPEQEKNLPSLPKYTPEHEKEVGQEKMVQPNKEYQHMQMVPVCCHCHQPCCQPMHHPFPTQGQMMGPPSQQMEPNHMMHHHPIQTQVKPQLHQHCGCESTAPSYHGNHGWKPASLESYPPHFRDLNTAEANVDHMPAYSPYHTFTPSHSSPVPPAYPAFPVPEVDKENE